MRRKRKAGRAFPLLLFPLGFGLLIVLAQGARVSAVARSQPRSTPSTEKEVIAKGRMVFGESCIQCHNMNAVLIQRKSAKAWRETVYSMISRGALLPPDDIEPLVAYLTATYGPHSPPFSPATAKPGTSAGPAAEENLPAGEGRQILSRTCVECHTLSRVTDSRESRQEWTETVARMVSYGAALRPAERHTLVEYLAKNFGDKK